MHNNPFSNNRAEYMRDLWKYYVPNTEVNFASLKPMIVEGGRGTGKTTLFMCNCWREKEAEEKNNGGNGIDGILSTGVVGIYYKVDPVFAAAIEKMENDSDGVFNTYFAIEIIKEILGFIEVAEASGKLSVENVKNISEAICRALWNRDNSDIDIRELFNECERALDALEDKLNIVECDECYMPRLTSPGTIVSHVIKAIGNVNAFANITFKVYVDEYESLSERQQRAVNTLIKRSDKRIVYSVGVKPKGIKTYETLANQEFLQKTHDYQYYNLDAIIADGYSEMLESICKKRLHMYFQEENLSNYSEDIVFYLGNYSFDEELSRFDNKQHPKFYSRLKEIIKEESKNEQYIKELCDDAEPFDARLHLALLLRDKRYKPSIENLCKGYEDYKKGKKTKDGEKYAEWRHNAQNGVVFLLAKDYSKPKWYYGFDTFVSLSSGIVRLFLELCEQAFSIAMQNGYKWEDKERISPEIQTRAANYVSRKQIMELETYAEHGRQMLIFTTAIGRLFRELHRNDNATLGEPEPNHFAVSSFEKKDDLLEEGLKNAVRYSVLQELPQTKEKEAIHTNAVDYHLNKIFAPYFGISYHKKRKLDLDSSFLLELFSEDNDRAVKAVRGYLKRKIINNSDLIEQYEQMTLF